MNYLKRINTVLIFVLIIISINSCKKNITSSDSLEQIEFDVLYSGIKYGSISFESSSINLLDIKSSNSKEIISFSDYYVRYPDISPITNNILFIRAPKSNREKQDVFRVDYQGNNLVQINQVNDTLSYYFPQFIRNDNQVLCLSEKYNSIWPSLRVTLIDTITKKVRFITKQSINKFHKPQITPDGKYILFYNEGGNLCKTTPTINQIEILVEGSYTWMVQISNNGKTLYYVKKLSDSSYELYSIKISGTNLPKKILSDIETPYIYVSPSERKILYHIISGSNIGTWIMDIDGTNKTLIQDKVSVWPVGFFPDETKILLNVPDNNFIHQLYTVNLDGSDLQMVTSGECSVNDDAIISIK